MHLYASCVYPVQYQYVSEIVCLYMSVQVSSFNLYNVWTTLELEMLYYVYIDMFTLLLLFCATEVQDSSATAVQQLCNSSTTELEV